jgi:hypothetical protein
MFLELSKTCQFRHCYQLLLLWPGASKLWHLSCSLHQSFWMWFDIKFYISARFLKSDGFFSELTGKLVMIISKEYLRSLSWTDTRVSHVGALVISCHLCHWCRWSDNNSASSFFMIFFQFVGHRHMTDARTHTHMTQKHTPASSSSSHYPSIIHNIVREHRLKKWRASFSRAF